MTGRLNALQSPIKEPLSPPYRSPPPGPTKKPVFRCVFDTDALINATRDTGVLPKWLRTGLVEVTLPSCVIDRLRKIDKAENLGAANEVKQPRVKTTILQLDGITDSFPAKYHLEKDGQENMRWADVKAMKFPKFLWNSYEPKIAQRHLLDDLSVEDDLVSASAKFQNALNISGMVFTPKTNAQVDANLHGSVPIERNEPSRVLAPIGTGRPTTHQGFAAKNELDKVHVAIRPIFGHMLWAMNKESELEQDHIWILIAGQKEVINAAGLLRVPCVSVDEMHQVLRGEDSEVDAPYVDPSSPKSHSSPDAQLEEPEDVVLLQLRTPHTVPSAGVVKSFVPRAHRQERRLNASGSYNERPNSAHAAVPPPIEPRKMREERERVGDNRKRAESSAQTLLDPESYERSPKINGHANGNGIANGNGFPRPRGGHMGHRSRRSGPDPPMNAPKGPRRDPSSSTRHTTSPTLANPAPQSPSIPNLAISRGPMLNGQGNFNHTRPQSSRSNGIPHSPSPAIGSSLNGGEETASSVNGIKKSGKTPRNLPYVPPPAREQNPKESVEGNEAGASTNPAAPLDLTNMDPDDFRRGEASATPILVDRTPHFGRGGRGGRGRGRGRGSRAGFGEDKRLFDPFK